MQRTVAGRYWTAFVGQPLSRLQTGTTVLATAPPEAKPGVLGSLRARVTAVGDWAIGRRGPERAVIATLALAYVLPFALALVALAMLASCAQPWCGCSPWPAPGRPAGRRPPPPPRRAALVAGPLAAALALLTATALAALAVIRAAELTHAADAYLGMLLAGSAAPSWPPPWPSATSSPAAAVPPSPAPSPTPVPPATPPAPTPPSPGEVPRDVPQAPQPPRSLEPDKLV